MTDEKHTIVGLGELLWNVLPFGKQLGGAPANFAYITNLLGDKGIPASRIGTDSLGAEALQRLTQLGLSADFRAAKIPLIPLELSKSKSTIPANRASTSCSQSPGISLSGPSPQEHRPAKPMRSASDRCPNASAHSRATIRSFLNATRPEAVRVFDVNLRQNFFSRQVLAESMSLATVVKLNHEELPKIMPLVDLEKCGEKDSARRLLSMHDLKLVCVTRGNSGSLLISADQCSEHAGIQVKVADTVGAGDAFTASHRARVLFAGHRSPKSMKPLTVSAPGLPASQAPRQPRKWVAWRKAGRD